MKRRLLLLSLASAPAAGWPQAGVPRVAVPYYQAADFVRGAYEHWFAPRSREFAMQAERLRSALQSACAAPDPSRQTLAEVRNRWRRAALSWDRLAGVAVGPLLARRSQRQIDFWPIRPAAIAKAIPSAPRDAADLERIGTPAKGLGALEWLLWSRERQLGQGGCAYAALLALEVETEAQALAAAFQKSATRDWRAEPQQAEAAMTEIVNQWVGGLESLRWQRMDKPARSAQGRSPAYPRQASGSARSSWSARWEALSALGMADPRRSPAAPGAGLVPLETYLRGRGLNPLADRLGQSMARAAKALRDADPAQVEGVQNASRAIARAKQVAEAEVAPALDVQIGFSDSDGD